MLTIRPFRGSDLPELLDLWNAALPLDGIDERTFLRKVLLDPNVAEGFLVAESEGQLVGFLLGLVRREPLVGVGLEEDKGWITAFGVHPQARQQGIGTALLERALDFFRAQQRHQVLVSPYTPNYFVPGVDVAAYPAALALLEKFDFQIISRPLSMDACLVNLELSEEVWEKERQWRERQVLIRPLAREDVPGFLAFLAREMPGDWLRHARELLHGVATGRAEYDQVFLAVRNGGEILGYCQFEGEHFGPFGVAAAWQGQGLGTLLLARTLLHMRRKGHHNAWVLWTDDHAARLYARFGFQPSRRFAVLRREL